MKVMNTQHSVGVLLLVVMSVYSAPMSTITTPSPLRFFRFDCDTLRREGTLSEDVLNIICGKNTNIDDNSLYNYNHLFDNNDLDNSYKSTVIPADRLPAFQDWGKTTTQVTTQEATPHYWNWWKKNGYLQTIPQNIIQEEPTFSPNWDNSWGNDNNNSDSTSTFGITGVVIGVGALVVLAVVLTLGLVYCCRSSRQNRLLRRRRLFLITARPDEDYDQFRHDMETTPPCVGLRVECPPSYEDALTHSNTPPLIETENLPPSYSAVIESSTEVTQEPTSVPQSVDAVPLDLEALQTGEEAFEGSMSSSSQLVLSHDKDSP